MAQKCEGCKIVEKYKYWSEFPATKHRFFKLLHSLCHLEIPIKFIDCFKEKLATWCTIIGSSEEKWKVKFTRLAKDETSTMQFSDGWGNFVSDNGLQINDILMFRYVGDSSFEVCVFDESGCERESSYFATNTSSSTRKRSMCTSSLHCGMTNCSASSSSSSEDVVLVDDDDDDEESNGEESLEKSEHEVEEKEDSSWEIEDESDDEVVEQKRVKKRTRGNSSNQERRSQIQKFYISKRRKLTEAEKQRALYMASRFLVKNRNKSASMFHINMLPTHVYRGFHLTIPKTWALKHMLKEPHEVELRVVPQTGAKYQKWIVGCRWTVKPVKQCKIRPLWPKFVLENNLEEHDVCVFELIQKGESKKKFPIFNVHIFRAIDHIVPLTVSRQQV